MTRLSELLRAGAPLADVRAHLDGVSHEARVAEVQSLAPGDVSRLYACVAGSPASLAHFVPAGIAPGRPVRHFGVNSLHLFRRFEKRFMRAETGEERLWGYNHQATMAVTGPGYFVVDPPADGAEPEVDYWRVPPIQPGAGWPKLVPNERFPTSLVYGWMRDRMRKVSDDVSVGHAWRRGKAMNAWFALVREPAFG